MQIVYIKYVDSNWPHLFKPYIAVGYVKVPTRMILYLSISIKEWCNQGGE